MRRKDREVLDINEIFDILIRCDTVRLGIRGEKYPYVLPVSFGAEMAGGRPVVWFHCARQDMKLDLLAGDSRVCVEGDIFIKTEPTDHGITTRYESVIGFGECRFPDDEEEMIHGLKLLTDHYGYYDYSLGRCRALKHVCVGKIILDQITGKRNLPVSQAAADRETPGGSGLRDSGKAGRGLPPQRRPEHVRSESCDGIADHGKND